MVDLKNTIVEYFQTCKGRCNHENIFTCRCDELCPYFGDCCIDYDSVCLSLTSSNITDTSLYNSNVAKNAEYRCVFDPSLDSNLWLVTRCPASWKDHFIESRCSDPKLTIRVFDQSGINYFNIFCAICHGHTVKDIQPWSMMSQDKLKRKRNLVCVKHALNNTDITGFSVGMRLRRCSQLLHECPTSYADEQVRALCHKYEFNKCSTEKTSITHKNVFCAKCNDVKTKTMTCSLSKRRGDVGELFQFRAKPDVKSIRTCPIGEIEDPFSLTCRPLTCISGYAMQNNKCVLKNGTLADILGNWKCESYDSLFFFQGMFESLKCVDEFLEKNVSEGSNGQFIHQDSNEDEQMWIALRFDTNRSLLLSQNIDAMVTNTRQNCGIYNAEFLTSCYHRINCSSSDRWFSGPPLNFIQVHHPVLDNVFLTDGTYIKAKIIIYHAKYERSNIKAYQRQEMLIICGSVYDSLNPDCLLIALSPNEYKIVNESVLLYHNVIIKTTDFTIQPDGQVLVCIKVLQNLKSNSTRHEVGFFLNALDIVGFVTSCTSLLCLLATIVTYAKFKKLRNMYGKCIMIISAILWLAYIFFLLSKVTWSDNGCIAFAIITHYLWLAMFTWSTISGVVLLQQFVIDKTGASVETTSFAVIVHVIGWGFPMLIVLITLSIHFCECTSFTIYGRNELCWIQDGIVNLVAFGLPVSFSILTNGIILSTALISLRRSRQRSNIMQAKEKDEGRMREVIIFVKVSKNTKPKITRMNKG